MSLLLNATFFWITSIKEEVIRKQLRKALRIARKRGVSVAICHPRENTLNVLEGWLEEDDASCYQYVTLSHIVKNSNTGFPETNPANS